ncbi:MAG: N-acetyltransferase, partial [Clostridia bacterium]|nr:N-acetyltransferase [Clostridia bacterium]
MIKINFDKNNNRAIALDDDKIVGVCEYTASIKQWNIVHTEVNEDYQGQGIAKGLVNCVIENATSNNITLTADCSYAKS